MVESRTLMSPLWLAVEAELQYKAPYEDSSMKSRPLTSPLLLSVESEL